jgi:hypothetical protein
MGSVRHVGDQLIAFRLRLLLALEEQLDALACARLAVIHHPACLDDHLAQLQPPLTVALGNVDGERHLIPSMIKP